jgi:hypothetical protein
VLALEISFLSPDGAEKHKIVEGFTKYMSLMPVLGLFPMKLIENTQLQSGETRLVRYALPSSLEGTVKQGGSHFEVLRYLRLAKTRHFKGTLGKRTDY